MTRLKKITLYTFLFSLTCSVFSGILCNSWHYDPTITLANPNDAKDRLKAAGFIEANIPTFSQEEDGVEGEQEEELKGEQTGELKTLFLKRENAIANIVFFHGFYPETKEQFAPFLKTAPKTCNILFVDTNISKNIDHPWAYEEMDIIYTLEILARNTNGLPTIIYGCRSGGFFAIEALKNFIEHDKENKIRNLFNIKGIFLDNTFTKGKELYRVKPMVKQHLEDMKQVQENENQEKSESKKQSKSESKSEPGIFGKFFSWIKKALSIFEDIKDASIEGIKNNSFIGPIIKQASKHMHNNKLCPHCILSFTTSFLGQRVQNLHNRWQLFSLIMSILKPIFGLKIFGLNMDERNKELINGIEKLGAFPIFILHTDNDPLSPVENIQEIWQKMMPYDNIKGEIIQVEDLKAKGVDTEILPLYLNPEFEEVYKIILEEFIKSVLGKKDLRSGAQDNNKNENNSLAPNNPNIAKASKKPKFMNKGSLKNSWSKNPKKKKKSTPYIVGAKNNTSKGPIASPPQSRSSSGRSPSRSYGSPSGGYHNNYYPRAERDSDNYARHPGAGMFESGPGASAAWSDDQPSKASLAQPGITSYDMAHCDLYLYEDSHMRDRPDRRIKGSQRATLNKNHLNG